MSMKHITPSFYFLLFNMCVIVWNKGNFKILKKNFKKE